MYSTYNNQVRYRTSGSSGAAALIGVEAFPRCGALLVTRLENNQPTRSSENGKLPSARRYWRSSQILSPYLGWEANQRAIRVLLSPFTMGDGEVQTVSFFLSILSFLPSACLAFLALLVILLLESRRGRSRHWVG